MLYIAVPCQDLIAQTMTVVGTTIRPDCTPLTKQHSACYASTLQYNRQAALKPHLERAVGNTGMPCRPSNHDEVMFSKRSHPATLLNTLGI